MNIEQANPDAFGASTQAGEVTLSQQAAALLDRYLAEVRSLARGLRSVSIQDVTTDLREHVFRSLRDKPAPIAAPEMEAALQRVGPAEQWLPLEELAPWRLAARRVLASPRLPYFAFATLVVGLMLPLNYATVLILASFCLARAAVTRELPGNQWQRWLIFPPLVVVYVIALSVLLFWPCAAVVGRSWGELGLPARLHSWIAMSADQKVPVSAGILAVGIWVGALGLLFTIRPTILRPILHPFAGRVSRWGTVLIAVTGLIVAGVGAALLRG